MKDLDSHGEFVICMCVVDMGGVLVVVVSKTCATSNSDRSACCPILCVGAEKHNAPHQYKLD